MKRPTKPRRVTPAPDTEYTRGLKNLARIEAGQRAREISPPSMRSPTPLVINDVALAVTRPSLAAAPEGSAVKLARVLMAERHALDRLTEAQDRGLPFAESQAREQDWLVARSKVQKVRDEILAARRIAATFGMRSDRDLRAEKHLSALLGDSPPELGSRPAPGSRTTTRKEFQQQQHRERKLTRQARLEENFRRGTQS
jgi:hypothetical protein